MAVDHLSQIICFTWQVIAHVSLSFLLTLFVPYIHACLKDSPSRRVSDILAGIAFDILSGMAFDRGVGVRQGTLGVDDRG